MFEQDHHALRLISSIQYVIWKPQKMYKLPNLTLKNFQLKIKWKPYLWALFRTKNKVDTAECQIETQEVVNRSPYFPGCATKLERIEEYWVWIKFNYNYLVGRWIDESLAASFMDDCWSIQTKRRSVLVQVLQNVTASVMLHGPRARQNPRLSLISGKYVKSWQLLSLTSAITE